MPLTPRQLRRILEGRSWEWFDFLGAGMVEGPNEPPDWWNPFARKAEPDVLAVRLYHWFRNEEGGN